ncbi:MAG: DUF938 domain-containing protein [Arenibacterium sp.]
MVAPAAERNADVIAGLISDIAPDSGRALELASGTGQHIVHLAAQNPGIIWQPSEVDPTRLASIAAYIDESEASNLLPPIELDATEPGWSAACGKYDMILLVNLLHLISAKEAKNLITESRLALSDGGILVLYGPFMRNGVLTSDGDHRFHTSLVTEDPEIGYKNDIDVLDWLTDAGFATPDVFDLPANNLAFCAKANSPQRRT